MYKLIAVIIILLFIALFPLPYGYYQLLRLVITVTSGFIIYKDYINKQNISFSNIIFGLILLLYNPIFPVHLEREIWQVINIITAIIFLIYLFNVKNKK